ncbi:MAG: hypothetical protein RMY16_26275 [Nostoc sp. DedQUE12b]|uniref:hypothetical protein n=1 Tax=Nostoc sp. DedQUE12b TaxID=3075398 RepID=UPI002AD201AA|nr:hypothetical protein [Nostoc sp. DedQUE12b]MDZ8089027.1 hypothetical protein [Nostoc sp. DedQUE12b]
MIGRRLTATNCIADQSIAITDGFSPSITTRNNAIYLRNTISIEVDKLLTGADVIDPDDY